MGFDIMCAALGFAAGFFVADKLFRKARANPVLAVAPAPSAPADPNKVV